MPTPRKNTEGLFVKIDRTLYRWLRRQAMNEGRFQWALVEEALKDLKVKRKEKR